MAEWSKLTFPSPQLLVHAVGCRFESFQWLLFVYLYSIFTSKKLSHPSSPSSRMRSCPFMVKVLYYLRWLVFVALWLLNTVCLRVYLFWLELLRSIWVMPDSIPELLPLQFSIWSAKPMSHHIFPFFGLSNPWFYSTPRPCLSSEFSTLGDAGFEPGTLMLAVWMSTIY